MRWRHFFSNKVNCNLFGSRNAAVLGAAGQLRLPFQANFPYMRASASFGGDLTRALLDDIPACAVTLKYGDPDVDHC